MDQSRRLSFLQANPFSISLIDRAEIGRSKNKPINITEPVGRGYLLIEYGHVKGLNAERQTEWELKERTILMHKQRVIEEVIILVLQKDKKGAVKEESYYFDITSVMHSLLNDTGFGFDLGDQIFTGRYEQGYNPYQFDRNFELNNQEVVWSSNKERMPKNNQ